MRLARSSVEIVGWHRSGPCQRVILPPDRRHGQGVRTRYRASRLLVGGSMSRHATSVATGITERAPGTPSAASVRAHASPSTTAPMNRTVRPRLDVRFKRSRIIRTRQSGSRSSELRVSTRALTFLCRHFAKAFLRRRSGLGAAQGSPNPRLERLGRWVMCGVDLVARVGGLVRAVWRDWSRASDDELRSVGCVTLRSAGDSLDLPTFEAYELPRGS